MRKLTLLLVPALAAGVMTAAMPAMARDHAAPTTKAAKSETPKAVKSHKKTSKTS